MKTYLLLNQAPRHEAVWGSGDTAPRVINIGTRWIWMVSFTPQLLYPQRKSSWYSF